MYFGTFQSLGSTPRAIICFLVIDLIILHSYHIVMTDICVHTKLALYFMNTKLCKNVILQYLQICLPGKFSDPAEDSNTLPRHQRTLTGCI